jgi:glucose/arabinose dehydrogenase
MTAARAVVLVLIAAAIVLAGCDNKKSDEPEQSAAPTSPNPSPNPNPTPPPGPTVGAMNVQIMGLAANVDAHVTVTGGGANRFLKASTALQNLAPGTYTITAESVLNGQSVLAPTIATQTATVTAGQTQPVTVSYNTQGPFALRVTEFIGSGLSNPMFLASPPNDARIFIAERGGVIRIFQNGQLLATPFLDISARTSFTSMDERGLLSFAFHPQFAQNGWVFVHFTDRSGNGDIVVERFTVSSNPNVANPQGTQVIKVAHQSATNHYGGVIAFGADGMLYISTGDGGGSGDQFQNAQNTSRLLGKLLRINVSTLPYTIPSNNPFANEVWARGLRNPFRWSFDRATNQIYIADVGQNRLEEVDVVPESTPGVNYGWPMTEATACFPNPAQQCNKSGLTLPVLEGDHQEAPFPCAITGGYVYRGSTIPQIQGRYFYSDYCGGFLRSFRYAGDQAIERIDWAIPDIGRVISFGEDANRELYVVTASGKIYRVARQ